MGLRTKYCKNCGKEIFPTPQWTYKRETNYFCSWKCYRYDEKLQPKKEIVLPKVGDTINIIYISGIPTYSNKVGVVEFFDTMGQMHGTWGGFVVIPGEDVYKIIGENNDEQDTNCNTTMAET